VPAAGGPATAESGWPATRLLSVFMTYSCFIGLAAGALAIACPLVVRQTESLQQCESCHVIAKIIGSLKKM
jgi:hypothetical protein